MTNLLLLTVVMTSTENWWATTITRCELLLTEAPYPSEIYVVGKCPGLHLMTFEHVPLTAFSGPGRWC